MFRSLLIANRGEIACRVIRTARRMGIRTIAVHSDVDAHSLHVREADAAVRLGPAPARDSYLNVDAVIGAALASGAEAVHPGYGFLSENAGFAEACGKAGLVFVGPPASAIRAMGDKSEAKSLMAAAGVPVVPGYHGPDQADGALRAEARRIGYPVLIKASAGGGGKGMKVAAEPGEFDAAVASARREALAAFGDGRLLLEKYLQRPRHVEIQVFADSHGNTVSLFERDCSIQRRHQKVIEEAPAPGLTPARRAVMSKAAVAAARAVQYVGAGTIEFMLERDGSFYFMEMNTRLQVEHPVTEMITGIDLVEWQLRVAAGEPLPLTQKEIAMQGHAVEARLYAEDPERGFLPQTGRIERLRFPEATRGVRVDTGVVEGDAITPYYDPLIAKVIAWGPDRGSAVQGLAEALRRTQIAGVATNASFLSQVVRHASFRAGEVDTGFIARHESDLFAQPGRPGERELLLAGLGILALRARRKRNARNEDKDQASPWSRSDGWRLNLGHQATVEFAGEKPDSARALTFSYLPQTGGEMRFMHDGKAIVVAVDEEGGLTGTVDGQPFAVACHLSSHELTLFDDGITRRFKLKDPVAEAMRVPQSSGAILAPMPGRVMVINVKQQEKVELNAPLLVLEAMKMEHVIRAPRNGVVMHIGVREGQQVNEGDQLVEIS